MHGHGQKATPSSSFTLVAVDGHIDHIVASSASSWITQSSSHARYRDTKGAEQRSLHCTVVVRLQQV